MYHASSIPDRQQRTQKNPWSYNQGLYNLSIYLDVTYKRLLYLVPVFAQEFNAHQLQLLNAHIPVFKFFKGYFQIVVR